MWSFNEALHPLYLAVSNLIHLLSVFFQPQRIKSKVLVIICQAGFGLVVRFRTIRGRAT